ncbi:MAG TPA: PA0069 family radical SAM protein [Planctomycetota bacterium]|nr:PA0069 family radical SAM protein [Planctomycetota bacterium]
MPRPVANPPNPWLSEHREWIGEPPPARLEVYEEEAASILSENDSEDVPFRWSANPYRGCFHGCAYCYARPTHQYLGFGAGSDFERRIVVKVNAPELLRKAFARRSWRGEIVALSGNTDCYQPLEASYRLTRGLLEACLAFRNPVGIITKSVLVRRDIDVLAELARGGLARVSLSIPFLDDEMARAIEPYAPTPSDRFEALREITGAGVSAGVGVAPVIPGLNDSQVAGILARAKECGATHAFRIPLRLPLEVKDVFLARLEEAYPDRYRKVVNAIREMRCGALNEGRPGARMTGHGARWAAIEDLFALHCRRLGLSTGAPAPPPTTARAGQMELF